jgi:hypothetical protein
MGCRFCFAKHSLFARQRPLVLIVLLFTKDDIILETVRMLTFAVYLGVSA